MKATSLVRQVVRTSLLVAGLGLVLAAAANTALAKYGPQGTPEIDPGSTAGALTLLVGGLLVLRSRGR